MKRKAMVVTAFLGLWTSPLTGQLTERLYQQACDSGDMLPCQILGILYQTGEEGVTQDLGKAAILFQTACEGEMWESCHRLGVMYGGGTGVNQDLDRGVNLLQRACDGREPQSCCLLRLDPVFTPMTVRPEILNRGEVQRAMRREYPPRYRDAGIGGRVVVMALISETGQVLDKTVCRSSGRGELDAAAFKVADVYQFTPARNGNELVRVWIELPITFQIIR